MQAAGEFRGLVATVVRRFFVQNGETPADGQIEAFATRLCTLVAQRGLPPPLAPGERGAPGELPEPECGRLVAQTLDAGAPPLLAEAARQLVKACFYPEFRTCRDSFRAVSADGSCRRQDVARARRRVSGAHCVDCPYWTDLAADEHAAFLRAHWCGDAAEFTAQRDVFLPEDFRGLRAWLHARARVQWR